MCSNSQSVLPPSRKKNRYIFVIRPKCTRNGRQFFENLICQKMNYTDAATINSNCLRKLPGGNSRKINPTYQDLRGDSGIPDSFDLAKIIFMDTFFFFGTEPQRQYLFCRTVVQTVCARRIFLTSRFGKDLQRKSSLFASTSA